MCLKIRYVTDTIENFLKTKHGLSLRHPHPHAPAPHLSVSPPLTFLLGDGKRGSPHPNKASGRTLAIHAQLLGGAALNNTTCRGGDKVPAPTLFARNMSAPINLFRAVPMQTLLVESKPQRLYHKKLYFPMQIVLFCFIWPTCLSHIYS